MSDTDVKAIIFDMDGVIVDSEPLYDQLLRYWLREHEVDVPLDFYREVRGGTWKVVFEYIQKNLLKDIDPLETANDMSDRIVDYIIQKGVPLYEGSRFAIEQLSKKYTLAVASSSHRNVVERVLEHHRLQEYFSHVTTFNDVVHPKPHPQPYAMTMAALGVQPEESVVIEDSLNGTKAGFDAGAFVYALPDHTADRSKFTSMAKVVHSFDEVLADLL